MQSVHNVQYTTTNNSIRSSKSHSTRYLRMGYYYNLFSIMWALILMTAQHAHFSGNEKCGILQYTYPNTTFCNKNASILETDLMFLFYGYWIFYFKLELLISKTECNQIVDRLDMFLVMPVTKEPKFLQLSLAFVYGCWGL